jgi:hypothetical protein
MTVVYKLIIGVVIKRVYAIGAGAGIALAIGSRATAAIKPPCNSVSCVAPTSLDDGIQQHLRRSFLQLRMICNRPLEWVVLPFDLAFDRNIWKSERTGQNRLLHSTALMTKEIVECSRWKYSHHEPLPPILATRIRGRRLKPARARWLCGRGRHAC